MNARIYFCKMGLLGHGKFGLALTNASLRPKEGAVILPEDESAAQDMLNAVRLYMRSCGYWEVPAWLYSLLEKLSDFYSAVRGKEPETGSWHSDRPHEGELPK